MALFRRPHTVRIQTATETPATDTKVVPVPTFGTARAVKGQMTPLKSEAVFQQYGLTLQNPHLFMANPEDAQYVHVGDNGTWVRPTIEDTLTFQVMTPCETYVTGLAGDHASCIVEITEFG